MLGPLHLKKVVEYAYTKNRRIYIYIYIYVYRYLHVRNLYRDINVFDIMCDNLWLYSIMTLTNPKP